MLDYICGQIRDTDRLCVCVFVCVCSSGHASARENERSELMIMVVNADEIAHLDTSFDMLDVTSLTIIYIRWH